MTLQGLVGTGRPGAGRGGVSGVLFVGGVRAEWLLQFWERSAEDRTGAHLWHLCLFRDIWWTQAGLQGDADT